MRTDGRFAFTLSCAIRSGEGRMTVPEGTNYLGRAIDHAECVARKHRDALSWKDVGNGQLRCGGMGNACSESHRE